MRAVAGISSIPAILDIVCRITGMGFAAVARVTEDRWLACEVNDRIGFGLKPGGELKVETTICHEIRQHRDPVAIDHVANDAQWCNHHTPAMYGIQSYISVPIILKDGTFFGTLCAIDPKPAKVNNPEVLGTFKLFAELVGAHLDAEDRMTATRAELKDKNDEADLREQFIAVLGHDLRNPLSAITSAAELMRLRAKDEREQQLSNLVHDCARRMTGIIENVMDLARSRLGGGVVLQRTDGTIERIVDHCVDELRMSNPGRVIDIHYGYKGAIDCDRARLAQLLSNLLGNALSYGDANQPVTVATQCEGHQFSLSVTNKGKPIPEDAMGRLFQPFTRGRSMADNKGLGLGLHIASKIAEAHGGTLSVVSTPDHTTFTFTMPV